MANARRLGLVVRTTKGALPALVAASIAPGAACGGKEEVGTTSVTDGTGARGGASGTGAAGASGGLGGATTGGAGGAGGNIGFAGLGGSGGTGGTDPCFGSGSEFIVELPPEGVPADPGQICAVSVDPVESNRAARVTLTNESQTLESAAGFIEIDPALEPRIVGNPVLELIDFTDAQLSGMQVEAMQRVAGGFTFQARWPAPVYLGTAAFARMTVRVSMELDCGAQGQQATRIVHAATDIHLCDGLSGAEWVSSGDRCIVCRVVAEMAPSPIVPDKNADGLPLARAVRLRVVELARVANAIVLLAENDGGPGLEYEWHPSAGHVERLAPDVVVWTVAEGMDAPFIQAAVWGEDAAAVASFAWNEAA